MFDSEQRIPMTTKGFEKIKNELEDLLARERPDVVQAIVEARSRGDLSENAEYHAAKERQSFIERRISELEGKVAKAQIIDISSIVGDDIKFGATVILEDNDTGESVTYQIVGSDEADVKSGLLSITSPLARALIGKRVGNSVEVSIPNGVRTYSVQKVEYI
ncbi:MAG: transcription elongation factor GreA [Holosporales bacterium]|jgi:transcription elongation factor GreA|nr:transcription elongation factor GreA [Holosporales bacterium]